MVTVPVFFSFSSCQYRDNCLPGKTLLRNDTLRVERDVKVQMLIKNSCVSADA